MAYDTFTDLSTTLQEYLEDDDTEFQGSIDDVINMGENRTVKDLDLALFRRTQQTAALTPSDPAIAKPTPAAGDRIIATKAAWLTGGGLVESVPLEHRSDEYVEFYNMGAADAVPKYFTDDDELNYRLAPPPLAAYVLNVRYLSAPARLVASTNETNWLTENVPELLFRACLVESEMFLKGDERIAIWKSDYIELLNLTKRDVYPQQNTQHERLSLNGVALANRSAM